MNDHPNGNRTDADVPDEEILYQEISDAELEIAAIPATASRQARSNAAPTGSAD
jgi:hypothetical protein